MANISDTPSEIDKTPKKNESSISNALALITALHGSHFSYLSALSKTQKPKCENILEGQTARIEAFMQEHRDKNLFFGIARRVNAKERRREACLGLRTLFVDIDFKDIAEIEARKELAKFPVPPSAIVASGGGLHVYWFLKEPLANHIFAKRILIKLAERLGGDLASAEPARILRLPDSLNHKYDPPRPVKLELINEHRYDLDEITTHLPPISTDIDTVSENPYKHNQPVESRIEKAKTYLAQQEPAIQGDHGRTKLVQHGIAVMRGFDLDPQQALLAFISWNARCIPPWDKNELENELVGLEGYGDEQIGGRLRPTLKITSATEIEASRVLWLWDGWMPLGVFTLCAGLEDQGKSTWSLHLAAQVTRGKLKGEFKNKPANVAIQATEDDWASIIKPRLMAAGADMKRIFRIDSMISLERDAVLLEETIRRNKIRLVIFDPVVTRLDGRRDANNYADVRRELETIGNQLPTLGCSILGITHFNKGTGPIENRVIGSRAWRAVVRAVYLVTEDPDDEDARLLVHNKSNHGPKQKSLKFEIIGKEVCKDPKDGMPIIAAKIEELGESEVTDIEAVTAMDQRHTRKIKSTLDRCKEWLLERVTQIPILAKTIKDDALAAGFSIATIQRASGEAGITVEGKGPGTTWKMEI